VIGKAMDEEEKSCRLGCRLGIKIELVGELMTIFGGRKDMQAKLWYILCGHLGVYANPLLL